MLLGLSPEVEDADPFLGFLNNHDDADDEVMPGHESGMAGDHPLITRSEENTMPGPFGLGSPSVGYSDHLDNVVEVDDAPRESLRRQRLVGSCRQRRRSPSSSSLEAMAPSRLGRSRISS